MRVLAVQQSSNPFSWLYKIDMYRRSRRGFARSMRLGCAVLWPVLPEKIPRRLFDLFELTPVVLTMCHRTPA